MVALTLSRRRKSSRQAFSGSIYLPDGPTFLGLAQRGESSMWKKDEAVRQPQPTVTGSAPASPDTSSRADASRHIERDMVNIGKSVVIKGELSGSEDLTIEGQVEGK